MDPKIAMVTGVTGQDGSYLSDLLLEKDYTVIGLHRRSSTNNLERIKHLSDTPNFVLEEFDLTDPSGCSHLINKYKPSEFYNLAAQSHVGTSFKQPTTTFEINTVGVINILEAIKNNSPTTKFYQASTSEMFGFNYSINAFGKKYQDENTQFLPQSPYGVAKLASHNMVRIYRSGYNVFGCCGILFNHESPRRGENFVTRKITKYIGRVKRGETKEKLKLGNLSAQRDWGHAKDYVRAMWMMMQQTTPDDFVISTGVTWSVQEFLDTSFKIAGLDPQEYVEIDHQLFRPAEVEYLRGSSEKAKHLLGWEPEICFNSLVEDMVSHDIQKL
jgi:GDPmannose 4,6-dehydratase